MFISNSLRFADVAAEVRRLAVKWHVAHDRISYDCLGLGHDFRNHLAREQITLARPIAGSGRAFQPAFFPNLRSEAAWTLRHRLDPDWVPDPRSPQSKPEPFHILQATPERPRRGQMGKRSRSR